MTYSFVRRLGRLAVKLVLIASLAGLLAGACGRYSADLDVLANARGHLIGLFTFAALALWLDYRPVLVLALGCFVTLAGHALLAQQSEGPLFATAMAAQTNRAGDWTILSLNTSRTHADPDALTDYLIDAGADVLVLTEFGPNKISQLHRLDEVYPYRKDCAADWDCSIAILSRHPFAAAGADPGGQGPARAWVTFGQGQDALTIVGVQVVQPLQSPSLHQRQLAALATFTRQFAGELLVAGDFNTTPWSNSFARFADSSGLAHMGRFLPTYPSGSSGLPQLALDHMFASPGLRFEDVWIGPDVGSPHRPLLAQVRLPTAQMLPAQQSASR